jgi:hypothetical protein
MDLQSFLSPSVSFSALFISSTTEAGLTVISTHEGINPLFTAFLTDRIFDQAEQ